MNTKKMSLLTLTVFIFIFIFIGSAFSQVGSAPGVLSAKLKGKSVELNWQAASGKIQGYLIKRSTENSNFETISFVSFGTYYLDNDVEKNKKYKYVVTSRGEDGKECGSSNEAEVTVKGYKTEVKKNTIDDEANKEKPKSKKNKQTAKSSLAAPKNVKVEIKKDEESEKDCIFVSWDKVNNAKGYRIYRAAVIDEEFNEIGSVKKETSFIDKKAKTTKSWYYYIVAFDDKGEGDKTKIASIEKSQKSNLKYKFGIAVSGSYQIGFYYNFESGDLYYTNDTTGTWQSWQKLANLSLPADFDDDCVINFGSAPGRVIAGVWNKKTHKTSFSECNMDSRTFNPWREFGTLNEPPNWSDDDTYILYDMTVTSSIMVSYNMKDGSLYSAKIISQGVWTTWEPCGNISKAPNFGPKSFLSVGIRELNGKAAWGVFCYNFEKNTIYSSIKPEDTFAWISWQPAGHVFGMPPEISN